MVIYIYIPQKNRGTAPPSRPVFFLKQQKQLPGGLPLHRSAERQEYRPGPPGAARVARRFQRRRGLFLEEITGGGRRPSAGRQAASVGESTLSIKHCK